jgi:polyisoprenoid-binding protein YceI
MMVRVLATALAGILAASVVWAIPHTTSTVTAASWTLDPVHCMAMFRVQHQGAGPFWGRFNEVNGTVTYPRDDSAGPMFDLTIPVASVDTGSTKLDGTLMGPNFFNAKEFETMTFVSMGVERLGPKSWTTKGDLTILGVTRPIEAMVEVTGVAGSPVVAKGGFEVSFAVKRSDFGMTWGVANGALGDDVRIIVGLEGESGPGSG